MSVSVVKADVCRPNKTPRTKQTKIISDSRPSEERNVSRPLLFVNFKPQTVQVTEQKRVGSFLFSYSHTSISTPPYPTPPQISAPSFTITDIYTQSYFQHHTKLWYIYIHTILLPASYQIVLHIYTHNPTSNITSHCCLSPTQNYLQLQSGRTT